MNIILPPVPEKGKNLVKSDFDKALAGLSQVDHIAEIFKMVYDVTMDPNTKKLPFVLFYGKGGYGKTTIANNLLKSLCGDDVRQMGCHSQMTVKDLLGGYDMKKLLDHSEVVQNIFSSVLYAQGVFLDEIFDMPSDVMLALKTLLLDGLYCAGNQCYKLPIRYHIGATNISPSDWVSQMEPHHVNSGNALLERYPIVVKVEWEDHSRDAYRESMEKIWKIRTGEKLDFTKNNLEFLLDLCELMSKTTPLSPRTVNDDLLPQFLKNEDVDMIVAHSIALASNVEAINLSIKYIESSKQYIKAVKGSADLEENIRVYKTNNDPQTKLQALMSIIRLELPEVNYSSYHYLWDAVSKAKKKQQEFLNSLK